MAAKRFIRPFAFAGKVGKDQDRADISDTGGDTSEVNYNTGYNARYALQYGVNPQALPVERQYFNGLMYDITSTLMDWQLFGFPEWFDYTGTTSPALSYSLGSMVRYRAHPEDPWLLFRSLKDNNVVSPSNDRLNWEIVPSVDQIFDSIALVNLYPDENNTPATGDFNNIPLPLNQNSGVVIRFPTSAKVRGWLNAPPTQLTARVGTLEQFRFSGGRMQRYSDVNGQVYARGYDDATSNWSPWVNLSQKGGATGAGDDKVFYLNDQAVTATYTIPSNQNAMTAGPITVNDGVTVTIPNGSTWTVV